MAITLGITGQASIGNGPTSCTVNMVGGTSGRLLVISWSQRGSNIVTLTVDGTTVRQVAPAIQNSNGNSFWFSANSVAGNYSIVMTLSGATGVGGAQLTVWEVAGAAGIGQPFYNGNGSIGNSRPVNLIQHKYANCAAFAVMHRGAGEPVVGSSPWVAWESTDVWSFVRGQYNLDLGAAGTTTLPGTWDNASGVVVIPDDSTAKVATTGGGIGGINFCHIGHSGSNRILIVVASDSDASSVTAVTFGGQNATKFGSDSILYDGSATDVILNVWYFTEAQLQAATVTSGGTSSVGVTGSATVRWAMALIVNSPSQATPINEVQYVGGTNTTIPVTDVATFSGTADANDIVLGFFHGGQWPQWSSNTDSFTTASLGGVAGQFDGSGVGVWWLLSTGALGSYTFSVVAPQVGSATAGHGVAVISVNRSSSAFTRYTGRRVREVAL